MSCLGPSYSSPIPNSFTFLLIFSSNAELVGPYVRIFWQSFGNILAILRYEPNLKLTIIPEP